MIGKLKLSSSGNGDGFQPVKSPVSNPAFIPMASGGTTSVVVCLVFVRIRAFDSPACTYKVVVVVIVGGVVIVAFALAECKFWAIRGCNSGLTRTTTPKSCLLSPQSSFLLWSWWHSQRQVQERYYRARQLNHLADQVENITYNAVEINVASNTVPIVVVADTTLVTTCVTVCWVIAALYLVITSVMVVGWYCVRVRVLDIVSAFVAVAAQPQAPVMLRGVNDRLATAALSTMVVSVTVVVSDEV